MYNLIAYILNGFNFFKFAKIELMKKILLIFFPALFFAQNDVSINFTTPIVDASKRTKSLTVRDVRADKEIGFVSVKGEQYPYVFADDIKTMIENQFQKPTDAVNATHDILVLIEKIKLQDNPTKEQTTDLDIRVSTFYKRNNNYFYINRIDAIFPNEILDRVYNAKSLDYKVKGIITSLIKESFNSLAVPYPLNEENLLDYATILPATYPINKAEKVSGVYLDYASFLKQVPSKYTYSINKKGKVSSVQDGAYSVPRSHVYAIVDNNKIYKATLVGYREVKEDDKGMYIEESYHKMFRSEDDTPAIMAAGGGLVGVLLATAVESSKKGLTPHVYSKLVTERIYLDPITFTYTLK